MAKNQQLEIALEALAHLICGDRDKLSDGRAQSRFHDAPPIEFDGFEVWHPDAVGDDDFVLMGNNAGDIPIWPFDVSLGFLAGDDWPEGSWQFRRVRTLDRARWRGRLIDYAPRMVELSYLGVAPNGWGLSARNAYGIFGNRAVELRQAVHQSRAGPSDPAYYDQKAQLVTGDFDASLRMAYGESLRRHYLWSVLLGEGKGPRARFVTDPIGVREVFRLRDIPPGERRRKALLHWVREHWRKNRSIDAAERARVRAHLRGEWSYTWGGLRCLIEPSAEDMERVAVNTGKPVKPRVYR